ncbi:MAG: hypothetical protein J6P14_02590 [Ruminococcus sp.]|jgi:hypothetical protein|nr:hypothetical protein [Ruminococcus sp.]
MEGNNTRSLFLGTCAAFSLGFIVGASLVAILDYRDEKITRLYKLRHDTDENYIYSE